MIKNIYPGGHLRIRHTSAPVNRHPHVRGLGQIIPTSTQSNVLRMRQRYGTAITVICSCCSRPATFPTPSVINEAIVFAEKLPLLLRPYFRLGPSTQIYHCHHNLHLLSPTILLVSSLKSLGVYDDFHRTLCRFPSPLSPSSHRTRPSSGYLLVIRPYTSGFIISTAAIPPSYILQLSYLHPHDLYTLTISYLLHPYYCE